ncbi:MAG: Na+/H+ antiporter, partial [Candidatus Eremiobacteraeota bacterium]|nr:Na+/H+ antiporter [Candidatus Eremiobacteraeota bacterium]
MEQTEVWVLLGLLGVSIPLIALARRANISYPIVLILGGLLLGFIPGLPPIALDPNLVLVIFLPPLLYWEAITAPTDVIRANWGQIWVLAFGLVVFTDLIVAVVAHAAIPHLTWALAFVLGAIVAPTDELASAPVLERLQMPRHLIAIVQGESLLNDASALILYVFALGAVVTGTFSLGRAVFALVVAVLGGIVLGLIVARLAIEGWRRIGDTQLQSVISVTLPYLTYSLAGRLGLSGVLAVVYAGFYANRETPLVIRPQSRLQLRGFWETIVFLVNTVLFLMVGLQLHGIARAVFAEYSPLTVIWYAFIVNLTIVVVRFAWLLAQEFTPAIGASSEHPTGDWKHAIIAGWSGLRGGVSLAAALALPLTVAGGAHFPFRNLIIFLTFSVIFVTLVLGGLTLPLAIGFLNAQDEGPTEEEEDVRRGLLGMSQAALDALAEIEKEGNLAPGQVRRLRNRYEHLRAHADGRPPDEDPVIEAERRLLEAERNALVAMRQRG